jgi:alkylation response protein AidB-like acyl-CoA dehydrogenase
MQHPISEAHAILEDSVRSFLAARHDAARSRAFRALGTGFDPGFWSEMADMGWLALRLPDQWSGLGLGIEEAALVAREFGEHAVPDPFITASLMPAAVLSAARDHATAERWARRSASGAATLSMMVGGEPVAAPAAGTRAGVRVYAAKTDSPLLIFASFDGRAAIVMLDGLRAEMAVQPTLHHDGSVTAQLELTGADLAAADFLLEGEPAAAAWRRALCEGSIALSAQLTGLSHRLLAMTIAYLKQRVQFGQPIATFQVIQHRLVDLSIAVQLAQSASRCALRAYQDRSADAEIALHAAKARCSDTAFEVARAAVQLHGAMGYAEECDVSVYFRSAITLSQRLGTAASHRRAAWSRWGSVELPVEQIAQ